MNKYLVNLSTYPLFGPARLTLLRKYFGSYKKVWFANHSALSSTGLSSNLVDGFIRHRSSFDESGYFEKLAKLGIKFVSSEEKDFPDALRQIPDAPLYLYIRGTYKKSDKQAIAIVGSRKMTVYGKDVAEIFTGSLCECGLTIVSGLARGIDTVAHKTALNCGARTIAVIGSGLDRVYPPQNTRLADEIVKHGSCVLSEYPLGGQAMPYNFTWRNRIISGLSLGVVVVEGRQKSGTLLTAKHAAQQGKEVFAIPANITSPMSEATNYLLKNGATLAQNPNDVLSGLGVDWYDRKKPNGGNQKERQLLEYIDRDTLHIDELVRITSMSTSDISARLTMLEIAGLVKNLGGGLYRKI